MRFQKLRPFSQKIAELIAGNALRGSKITNQITQEQTNAALSVEEHAKTIAAIYSLCRDAQIKMEIFRTGGISKAGFYYRSVPGDLSTSSIIFRDR
jgi:hypothetical protein